MAGSGGAQAIGAQTLAFSPDGKLIAVGDFNGSTYLWNVARGSLIARLLNSGSGPFRQVGTVAAVIGVAFRPDGRLVATADATGAICLWNTATQRKVTTLTEPTSLGLNAMALSHNGRTIVAADANGNAYLWQITWPA